MALRTVGVRLAAEVAGFRAGMRQAGASVGELRGELDQAARAGRLDALADQASRMGLVMVAGFGAAVAVTAKFDKQMSEVGAVANATGKDMELLRQAALDAGKATAFSATEAAKAEAELAKAGLSTSQILGGALTGSLALAAAGSLDLAESADIAAKTMNVFKLRGSDVGHIADVLAAAANKSATDVHEMGEALKQGGLAANGAGLSLEETVGTLSAFADRALVGSDAGTSLKTMLMMLQAPTDKAKALMDQLGIAAYDANGQFVGTVALAGQLQKTLGGLTQEQRNAALAQIFGADAMRAANVLYEVGEVKLRDYVSAVDDQGAAADVAAKKMDNLAGDVEKLKGSLETMAIEAGSGSTSGLRMLVQTADNLVDSLASIPAPVQQGLVAVAGFGGATLLAAAGAAKLHAATTRAGSELAALGPRGERAARGLDRASRAAGRAGVAFVALEVAGAVLATTQDDLNPQIDAMAKGLAEWGRTGKLAGESARVLGTDMKDLGVGFKFLADTDNGRRQTTRFMQDMLEKTPLLGQALQGTNTSLARTRERVDAMDQSLAQMVQSGNASDAAAFFDRFAASQAQYGVSVDEVKAKFPAYAAALESTGKAAQGTAGGIGQVGAASVAAAQDADKLKQAFDALFGDEMSYDKAVLAYKQGIADVKAELRDGTRTLNDNTQAGRDNVAAVLEQVDRIKALRDARLEHGATLDDANAKYVKDIDGLRRTMLQAGYTKDEVDQLIGKYRAVPGDVSTNVSAPGTTKATGQVQDFNFAVRSVPPSKTVPFWATTAEARAAVDALKSKINELKDKHIYISGTVRWTSTGDLKVPGGTQLKGFRHGGIVEHAASGLLREAQIAAPQGPARYAWAEPETGGELFAPRFGDMNRTRALVGYAIENWWGGWQRFAPSGGAGGQAGGQVTYDNRITVQPRQANFTVHDLTALQQRQDALSRVGRPR
ncbi:phage tail tape measure protein [Micromonospora sp. NPDC048169]|uniref:phage tail tape measure protein n=1 Tax=Micromonospora sp. NPDC048169 TaxID=3154711 RepID=UPI0033C9D860